MVTDATRIFQRLLYRKNVIYLKKKTQKIGEKYGASKTTIAFSWILRHPAKMQPVTGTTNLERLKDCLRASEIEITREEWYEIYRSAGNILP